MTDSSDELALKNRIEPLCDRFEEAWRRDGPQSIESYLDGLEAAERQVALLELLLLDLWYRQQRDLPRARQDYTERFVGEEEVVARAFRQHRQRERQAASTTKGEGGTDSPADRPADSPAAGDETPRRLGDYQLLGRIAAGGMGVVWRAWQLRLGRMVAVKTIREELLDSTEALQRFQAEAQAAAGLDHPGIVPIYEVGQAEGYHFFSMAYVEGGSLSERLAERPLPPREAAELVAQVAEAIEHAHRQGVIHRDLKPSNILLDVDGKPRVTDFGLAKHTLYDQQLTTTGQVMGTPSYMPPEQARGETAAIGPTADVYSLGAVLYCLLAGHPPFQAANLIDALHQVNEKDPVPLRTLNTAISADLEVICAKCLEKHPRHRYASAAALHDELQRFLRGEPLQARPLSRPRRALRWIRRRPVTAGLIAAGSVAALLSVALAVGLLFYRRLENAKTESDRLRAVVQQTNAELEDRAQQLAKQKEQVDRLLSYATVRRAKQAFLGGRYDAMTALLNDLDRRQPTRRDAWERALLRGLYPQTALTTPFAGRLQAAVAAGPVPRIAVVIVPHDNPQLAVVEIFDAQRNSRQRVTKVDAGERVTAIDLTEDARHLAVARTDAKGSSQLAIWDCRSDPPKRIAKWTTARVHQRIALAPDGLRLAAVGRQSPDRPGNRITIYNRAGREDESFVAAEVGKRGFAPGEEAIRTLDFSPSGERLAWTTVSGALKVWEKAGGPRELFRKENTPSVFAWSPDGKTLAWAASGSAAVLRLRNLDASSEQEVRLPNPSRASSGAPSPVARIAYHPDGDSLVIGRFADLTVVDLKKTRLPRPRRQVACRHLLTWTWHAHQLIAVSYDGKLRAWDLTPRPAARVDLQHPKARRRAVAFEPRGQLFATSNESLERSESWIALHAAEDGRIQRRLELPAGWEPHGLAFSPSGRKLVVAGSAGSLQVWERSPGASGDDKRAWRGPRQLNATDPADTADSAAFLDERRVVALGGRFGQVSGRPPVLRGETVNLWDAESGKLLLRNPLDVGRWNGVAVRPQTAELIALDLTGVVRFWNLDEARETRRFRAEAASQDLAVDPSGRLLAFPTFDDVKLVSLDDGSITDSLVGHRGFIVHLTFQPGGRRLATAGSDGTIRLWETRTGQLTDVLTAPFAIQQVAWSPDGRRLVAVGSGRTILWYAARNAPPN